MGLGYWIDFVVDGICFLGVGVDNYCFFVENKFFGGVVFIDLVVDSGVDSG